MRACGMPRRSIIRDNGIDEAGSSVFRLACGRQLVRRKMRMDQLMIREANENDAEKMIAYLNMVGGESDNLMYGKDEFQVPAEQVRSHINRAKRSDNSVIFIGMLGDEIVAKAALEGYSNKRMRHRAKFSISVKKEHWNQGIGTAMMDETIARARELGIKVIELEVLKGNAGAIALYHKMGFWDLGIYENFWFVNNRYEDAILMCLGL